MVSGSAKLYTELFLKAVIRQLVYSAHTCFSAVLWLKMNLLVKVPNILFFFFLVNVAGVDDLLEKDLFAGFLPASSLCYKNYATATQSYRSAQSPVFTH